MQSINELVYNFEIMDADFLDKASSLRRKQYFINLKNAVILHYSASIKPINFKKMHKLTIAYKEFYKYYQMSYLRVNALKLKFIFLVASINRLRRRITGSRIIENQKVFYFFNFMICLKKF